MSGLIRKEDSTLFETDEGSGAAGEANTVEVLRATVFRLKENVLELKDELENAKLEYEDSLRAHKDEICSLTIRVRNEKQKCTLLESRLAAANDTVDRITEDLGQEVRKREEAQAGYNELLRQMQDILQNEDESAALKAERRKSAQPSDEDERSKEYNDRMSRDLSKELRKREGVVVPKKILRVSDQYSREYVSEMAEKEGLSMMEQSKIDGLIAAKMREWEGKPERNEDGRPLFIHKMLEYCNESKDPWDAIQAQYLYLNRRDLRADEIYLLENNALHICAQTPFLSPMLRWLLEDGSIDPSKGDFQKSTPLHRAVVNNNMECATLLLNDERVDKDARDNQGCTPLIYAAVYNHRSMAALLLQHGCNKNIRNDQGQTARMIFEQDGSTSPFP